MLYHLYVECKIKNMLDALSKEFLASSSSSFPLYLLLHASHFIKPHYKINFFLHHLMQCFFKLKKKSLKLLSLILYFSEIIVLTAGV